mmetsp:Transcript_12557/g.33105  ORF Transcript_12557/g.33105 Transcript_12557/m.33105 type:complete len:238 (-) Transcript_12557:1285-1998(-)
MTASFRMFAPALESANRFSMISTPSRLPSSFCNPGKPTTEMRSINAPLTNPSADLADGLVALVFWVASSLPSSQASKNLRARMWPCNFWKAAGARGARFNSTAMACCCKTCNFVSSRFFNIPGILLPFTDTVSRDTAVSSSSHSSGSSAASKASTSKYMSKAPMKSASTTNLKFSSSARPKSLNMDHRMRFVSRSSFDDVAKVCLSASGGSVDRGSRPCVACVRTSIASSGSSAAQA